MKERIEALKKEKNAVILAHYYAPAEVQALADYVGDSFYLAKMAARTTAEQLVFCGVSFMGESAKLLNPEKKVLMPFPGADCPMAHMVAPGAIARMREKYEDLCVVCYINSTAALKSESDVCVTSSNAVKIVRTLPQKNIFFIPDRNLGRYVAEQVPEKNILLNDGCCPIHASLTPGAVQALRTAHPTACVMAHPECEADVLACSDYIGSTADMLRYAATCTAKEMIVCTEEGVLYGLKQACPQKTFYFPTPSPCCRDMKYNTVERVLAALENGEGEVILEEAVCRRARLPLERMLELAK